MIAQRAISRKGPILGANNRIDPNVRATAGQREGVMAMTVLWRTVQGRWHDLVQAVWPDSAEEQTRAEIVRLDRDLAHRHQRLVRLCRGIEQVRDRLIWTEQHLNESSQEILDRLRRRLARLEGVYEDRRRRLERRKRLRQALASGRLQVVEVVHGTGCSDEV
jgi:hypothetical protein